MYSRVDHHRSSIRVFACDPFIHLKKIAVFFPDDIYPVSLNGIFKIEVNGKPGWPYPFSLVTYLLCIARCHIAGDQVSKTRVLSLQIVVPF